VRILFVHRFFPGQFGSLARSFAARPDNEVVFIATEHNEGAQPIDRVRTVFAPVSRPGGPDTHHYLQGLENAVLAGQATFRACAALRQSGFVPDLIYAHAGFGPGLYLKEAFPGTPLLGYFEWYYHPRGTDADFETPEAVSSDEALRIRTKNADVLLELAQCDKGICPTRFQHAQFPPEFRDKLTVLHDGIDTDAFAPGPRGYLPLVPDLPSKAEIVTYATRGLEPYRGFPQFMRAVALLQTQRPNLHAVIVGKDATYYGRLPPGGVSWKDAVLRELPRLDPGRVHFLGHIAPEQYRQVLRASDVYAYLTVPFVLSWSLLEAMASGCTIVGSDTPPVRELVHDGVTGWLADFHDPAAIAERFGYALDHRKQALALGEAARRHIVQNYSLPRLLPRHMALARAVMGREPLAASA
jgi:glycosyltransferase involved in cell wall biosynthesis